MSKYIFSQVVDFVYRYEFDKCVKRYNGDYHVRELSCYNQFLHLLFGQLTACESLRDICLCLKAHKRCLFQLGFRQTVNESSLSRANERRDYRIYEDLGYYLIGLVRPPVLQRSRRRCRPSRVRDLRPRLDHNLMQHKPVDLGVGQILQGSGEDARPA